MINTVFIHGRPAPHPIHIKIGKRVHSDFRYVDEYMRWHDQERSALYRYLSWFYNALFFGKRSAYTIFFSEGLHVLPVLMKKIGLLRSDQKTAALLANEVLFFTYEKRYSKLTLKVNRYLLNHYDVLFCIGEFEYELAQKLVTNKHTKILRIFNGVPSEKIDALSNVAPDLESHNILFIAHGPSGWRTWYKGLDLMIEAFDLAQEKMPSLRFTIVGDWDDSEISKLLSAVSDEAKTKIHFVGRTSKIEDYFAQSALYLHCARGDSFPTTVLESMSAGLPALISETTGTYEIIRQVAPDMVVAQQTNVVADAIFNYFSLPLTVKKALSEKSRTLIANYSEEAALSDFEIQYTQTFSGYPVRK